MKKVDNLVNRVDDLSVNDPAKMLRIVLGVVFALIVLVAIGIGLTNLFAPKDQPADNQNAIPANTSTLPHTSPANQNAAPEKQGEKAKAVKSAIVESGDVGDTCRWELDDKGVLWISPTPYPADRTEPADYGEFFAMSDDVPWASCASKVKSVVFEKDTRISGNKIRVTVFENQPIESVDMSELDVSDMHDAISFAGCQNLRSVDMTGWDTSRLSDASFMFYGCTSLESVDLSAWDTGYLSDTSFMFANCSRLSSASLAKWDTVNLCNASYMFSNCPSLASVDTSNWNTAKLRLASSMFYNCPKLKNLDCSLWDMSNAQDVSFMFYNCMSFDASLTLWSMPDLRSASHALYNCPASPFKASIDLSNVATSISEVPAGYAPITEAEMVAPQPADIIDKGTMDGCTWTLDAIGTIKISPKEGFSTRYERGELGRQGEVPWDEKHHDAVRTIVVEPGVYLTEETGRLFENQLFERAFLSGLDVSRTEHAPAFSDCPNLRMVETSGWNTSKWQNTQSMFADCPNLVYIDCSAWDMANVMHADSMFYDCRNLCGVSTDAWRMPKLITAGSAFYNCPSARLDYSSWGVEDTNPKEPHAATLTLSKVNLDQGVM